MSVGTTTTTTTMYYYLPTYYTGAKSKQVRARPSLQKKKPEIESIASLLACCTDKPSSAMFRFPGYQPVLSEHVCAVWWAGSQTGRSTVPIQTVNLKLNKYKFSCPSVLQLHLSATPCYLPAPCWLAVP